MSTPFLVASRLIRVDSILRDVRLIRERLEEAAPSAGSKGHHKDSKTGEAVHSSGKKENKKFANNTTFKPSPGDALLHTDGNKEGVRAKLKTSNFAFHDPNADKSGGDPTKKWFPVSYQRGWASAAGSLRQAYAHPKAARSKVIDKVKKTRFIGAEGQPIEPGEIKPTGALHNERPHCGEGSKGQSHPFASHDPGEHYRLCKGVHGAGGPPEHATEFNGKKAKSDKHKAGWVQRSHLDATGISGIDSARHRQQTKNRSFEPHEKTKIDFDRSAPKRVERHKAVHEPVTNMIDTAHRTKFRLTP